MQSLSKTRNLLFAHLKETPDFHSVSKITVNELADESFWNGINNVLTPSGMLCLKGSTESGNARQRESVWGFVIIVNGKGEDAEDNLLACVEKVQARLTHYFGDAPGLMLMPDSELTMLTTGSQYMAGELQIKTEDSD